MYFVGSMCKIHICILIEYIYNVYIYKYLSKIILHFIEKQF